MTLQRYVGLPFVAGGRGPGAVDCWGLVCFVYRQELGLDLPLHADVRVSDVRAVSRAMDTGKDAPEWVAVDDPRPLDVAVMRLPSSGRPGHVGLCAGGGMILHVERAASTVLEPATSPMIAHRIIGYWRHASQC